MNKKSVKLTIITACYNAEKNIRNTVESVLQQTYQNYEYIIIDGNSNDKTLEILKVYEDRVNLFSENDFGIYNAMNRGIARAIGEYVYFLNAGDSLFDEHVLENVAIQLEDDNTIYYGVVNVTAPGAINRMKDFDAWHGNVEERLLDGIMPCHQAIFAPKKLLRTHYFREDFELRADYEWLFYSVTNGARCQKLSLIVANYDLQGISGSLEQQEQLLKETNRIIHLYQNRYEGNKKNSGNEMWLTKIQYWKALSEKHIGMVKLFSKWITLLQNNISVTKYFEEKKIHNIAIYGMGIIGEQLLKEVNKFPINVRYLIDRKADDFQLSIPVVKPEDSMEPVEVIVVTVLSDLDTIKELLESKNIGKIVSIDEVVQYCTNAL